MKNPWILLNLGLPRDFVNPRSCIDTDCHTSTSKKLNSTSIEMAKDLDNGNATKGPSAYKGLGKRKAEDAEDDEAQQKAGTFDVKRFKANGSARSDEEATNNKQKTKAEEQGSEDVDMGGIEEGDGLDPEL